MNESGEGCTFRDKGMKIERERERKRRYKD